MAAIPLTIATMAILLIARRKSSIGLSAVIAGLFLAWATGGILGGLKTLGVSFHETFLQPGGYDILLAVAFITMLGNTMRVSGAMDELVQNIRLFVRDTRKLIFLIPSFSSLVTGTGAGVLPAPLLDSVGDEIGLSQEKKAAATVLFRHIWSAIYPICTPFILFQRTSGMPYKAILLPGITTMIVVGVVSTGLIFKDIPAERRVNTISVASEIPPDGVRNVLPVVGKMLYAAMPLLVLLILRIGFSVSFPVSCGIGCLCALLPVSLEQPFFPEVKRRVFEGAIPGLNWNVIGTVAGILLFSRVVVNSGLVDMLAPALSGHALSLLILSVIVPFGVGFMIGSQPGTIGLALPLLLPLTRGKPDNNGFLALFYLSSLMGYMVSPAHVCFIGTVQCLNANFKDAWRMVLVSGIAGLFVCLAFGIYWII